MKRWIGLCAVVLALQLGLTVWTQVDAHLGRAARPGAVVLGIAPAGVGELTFEDQDGRSLFLRKSGNQWVLPAAGSFPADSNRIQALVERLAGLRRGWPEGTTADAATRFEAAPDRFVRKLRLGQEGQTLRTVYFGTAAGARATYVRMDGDPEVYAINLGPRDLDLEADSWISPAVLHLKPEEVARVSLPGLELVRTAQGLQPAGLSPDEEAAPGPLAALVDQLTRLSVKGLLGAERKPEFGLDKPVLRYTVELAGGVAQTYRFGLPPKGTRGANPSSSVLAEGEAALQVSSLEQLFRVEAWQVEEIRKASRASLVRPRQAPARPDAPAGSGPGPGQG